MIDTELDDEQEDATIHLSMSNSRKTWEMIILETIDGEAPKVTVPIFRRIRECSCRNPLEVRARFHYVNESAKQRGEGKSIIVSELKAPRSR